MSSAVFQPAHDPDAELLLEATRARAGTTLDRREMLVEGVVAVTFAAAALAMALLLPSDRAPGPEVGLLLVVLYAAARQVGFEIATGYTSPLVVVLVPMLFLLPAALVPAYVAAGMLLGGLITRAPGRRRAGGALLAIGQSWHAVGPALVISLTGEGVAELSAWPIFLAALIAMFATDAVVATFADCVGLRAPLRLQIRPSLWVYGVDAALAPIGFLAAIVAVQSPAGVALVVPLLGLLWLFAHERTWRIDQAVELSAAYRGTALLLGDMVEVDHAYTGSHSRDVVGLAVAVGKRMRLGPAQLRDLEFGALLHDVGKIAVPKEIINKPGPLDDAEWAIMRRHTIEGQRMLESVGGVLARVGVIVRASHEAHDGTGYPDGLAGDAIPIESRICSACDAFSAMTTDRSYRAAMTEREALAELRRCAGAQFDPRVVIELERLHIQAPLGREGPR